jgi:hypothetical protein
MNQQKKIGTIFRTGGGVKRTGRRNFLVKLAFISFSLPTSDLVKWQLSKEKKSEMPSTAQSLTIDVSRDPELYTLIRNVRTGNFTLLYIAE